MFWRSQAFCVTMLSFAIPGTVIGVSYILAFNVPPVELTGTGIILIICFVFRNMPVGVRAGMASMSQIDRSLDEASLTLRGRAPQTLLYVVLPLLRPAVVTAHLLGGLTVFSLLLWFHPGAQRHRCEKSQSRFGRSAPLQRGSIGAFMDHALCLYGHRAGYFRAGQALPQARDVHLFHAERQRQSGRYQRRAILCRKTRHCPSGQSGGKAVP